MTGAAPALAVEARALDSARRRAHPDRVDAGVAPASTR